MTGKKILEQVSKP